MLSPQIQFQANSHKVPLERVNRSVLKVNDIGIAAVEVVRLADTAFTHTATGYMKLEPDLDVWRL